MIEVFKTDILTEAGANALAEKIRLQFPCYHINFDLGDCDKILRVVGDEIDSGLLIGVADSLGFKLEALE